MPPQLAVALRASCLAVALIFATVRAGEPAQASLIGASRDQVLDRLGEPKSSLMAGNREVLIFSRERVVLRDNVVIEFDLLPADPVRPPPPPPEPAADTAAPNASTAVTSSEESTVAPESVASPETPMPARTAPRSAPATVSKADAPLEIKAVRKTGTSPARTAQKTEPAPTQTVAVGTSQASTPTRAPVVPSPVSPPPATPTLAPTPASTPAPEPANAPPELPAEPPPAPAVAVADDGAAPEVAPPESPISPGARNEYVPPDAEIITTQTYVIAFIVIVGGAGYLIWRSRQRELELAASAVSRTPFTAPTTTGTGARFAADLLGKLEWKRFEELVAAYYSKTGVVAVRTKSGPASPVHIKISWKGEPRPFAYVLCVAHPDGLVDAAPIQELVNALAADDIRRGYVVTTGKFNVPARDLAEEKHITLLPGDIFLEKLNALPDSARNELMQETTAGDYKTPSCPKCEARMVVSPDDPLAWQCAAHPEMKITRRS